MTLLIEAFVRRNHPRLIARYPRLNDAQVCLIPASMIETAYKAVFDASGNLLVPFGDPWPVSGRPIAKHCVYYLQSDHKSHMAKIFAMHAPFGDKVAVEVYRGGGLRELGYFTPGSCELGVAAPPEKTSELLLVMAWILALCNESRLVENHAAGDRSFRRQMSRTSGISANAPIVYRWRTQSHKKKQANPGSEGGVALHWRRGHWRVAESHWHGAVNFTDHADSTRSGWHVWIDGMWVGDPANGICRKFYTPPVSDFISAEKGH